MKGDVHPNRSCIHRYMGPVDSCDKCGGRGYFIDETQREKYCDCPCGDKRRETD